MNLRPSAEAEMDSVVSEKQMNGPKITEEVKTSETASEVVEKDPLVPEEPKKDLETSEEAEMKVEPL